MEFIKRIECDDIYLDETRRIIESLKLRRERISSYNNYKLFQYGDTEFELYFSYIEWLKKRNKCLLINILQRVMERYCVSFKNPDIFTERNLTCFDFILYNNGVRIGCVLSDEYIDKEHIKAVLNNTNRIGHRISEKSSNKKNMKAVIDNLVIDEARIIRPYITEKSEMIIDIKNDEYRNDGFKIKEITLESFFNEYICAEEYEKFISYYERYLEESREIIGYKSIEYLSNRNMAKHKHSICKELAERDYLNFTFNIIDRTNPKIKNYLYLSNSPFDTSKLQEMKENYLSDQRYKSMIGINDYAKSFITSEWLYHVLKEKKNFDYTSIVSGYLKSIEQLLYKFVLLNVENNCKITLSSANSVISCAINNNVVTYQLKGNRWLEVPIDKDKGYKYIDLTSNQLQFIDSSIGSFEYFLRNNPHIFINQGVSKTIADMVCCFRIECRNGFFHTHNLEDWEVVEKIRSNAIFLYFVLLGGCIIPDSKIKELGIHHDDSFSELCKKIQEFSRYSIGFIFEYDDNIEYKLIYSLSGSKIEYDVEGITQYESLGFVEVNDFGEEVYLKKEIKWFNLTKDNLPKKIFCVQKDNNLVELIFSNILN